MIEKYKKLSHELLLIQGMVGQERKEVDIQCQLDEIWRKASEVERREINDWVASAPKDGSEDLGLEDRVALKGSGIHPRKEKT